MMEKCGVVTGEGDTPTAKEATDKKCPDCGHAPGERGHAADPKKACGTDLMSKMADEVAHRK